MLPPVLWMLPLPAREGALRQRRVPELLQGPPPFATSIWTLLPPTPLLPPHAVRLALPLLAPRGIRSCTLPALPPAGGMSWTLAARLPP